MAELHPQHFHKPLLTIAVILLLILPSLLAGMAYTWHPTRTLDDQPRLLFGKSTNGPLRYPTHIISKSETDRLSSSTASATSRYSTLLGYNSPLSLDNALVAYRPREVFAEGISPHQIMWFGIICPLTSAQADAYEATTVAGAKAAGQPVPAWVRRRPLYSFDCSRDYPEGFDFTVIVKLPMFQMQQFRLEMWSGRETPVRGMRQLTNLSIADYAEEIKAPSSHLTSTDSGTVGFGAASQDQEEHASSSAPSFSEVFPPPPPAAASSSSASNRAASMNAAELDHLTMSEAEMALIQEHAAHMLFKVAEEENRNGNAPSAAEGGVVKVADNKNTNANNNTSAPSSSSSSSSSLSSSSTTYFDSAYSFTSYGTRTANGKEPVVGNHLSNTAATASLSSTEVIKTCDKITDDCVQASMFTYTRSYKLVSPQTRSVGHSGRLAIQHPAADGLYQVSISSDLGKVMAEVDILIAAEPAVGTRSAAFRGLAGLFCLFTFLLLFVIVKVVGLYIRKHDTTRIFSLIDPSHDEVVYEAWEDVRKLWQYCIFTASEARSRWAARRRRFRRAGNGSGSTTPNQTDALTLESTSNNSSIAHPPLSPTSMLAAKAKASQAAANSNNNNSTAANGYPSSSEEEGDVCRICRVGEPRSDLVAPCACAGTSRYIHRACLEQWRSMTSNPDHQRICAECKTEYNVAREIPRRSVAERLLKAFSPLIKVGILFVCFIAFGYAIKAIALLTQGDPYIDWRIDFYHVSVGSLALFSIMIVFSNGLWFVIDFPKTLYQRIPALVFLGVAGPILLGYAAQLWSAVLFDTIVTPEISFGAGVFMFVAFVNNVLVKMAEVLTPNLPPLGGHRRQQQQQGNPEVAADAAANSSTSITTVESDNGRGAEGAAGGGDAHHNAEIDVEAGIDGASIARAAATANAAEMSDVVVPVAAASPTEEEVAEGEGSSVPTIVTTLPRSSDPLLLLSAARDGSSSSSNNNNNSFIRSDSIRNQATSRALRSIPSSLSSHTASRPASVSDGAAAAVTEEEEASPVIPASVAPAWVMDARQQQDAAADEEVVVSEAAPMIVSTTSSPTTRSMGSTLSARVRAGRSDDDAGASEMQPTTTE